MNTHYQTTLKIVKALRNLQCPVCGQSPRVDIISNEKYDVYGPCHKELGDLISQTEELFRDSRYRRSESQTD